jgi:hypothetical protein
MCLSRISRCDARTAMVMVTRLDVQSLKTFDILSAETGAVHDGGSRIILEEKRERLEGTWEG